MRAADRVMDRRDSRRVTATVAVLATVAVTLPVVFAPDAFAGGRVSVDTDAGGGMAAQMNDSVSQQQEDYAASTAGTVSSRGSGSSSGTTPSPCVVDDTASATFSDGVDTYTWDQQRATIINLVDDYVELVENHSSGAYTGSGFERRSGEWQLNVWTYRNRFSPVDFNDLEEGETYRGYESIDEAPYPCSRTGEVWLDWTELVSEEAASSQLLADVYSQARDLVPDPEFAFNPGGDDRPAESALVHSPVQFWLLNQDDHDGGSRDIDMVLSGASGWPAAVAQGWGMTAGAVAVPTSVSYQNGPSGCDPLDPAYEGGEPHGGCLRTYTQPTSAPMTTQATVRWEFTCFIDDGLGMESGGHVCSGPSTVNMESGTRNLEVSEVQSINR